MKKRKPAPSRRKTSEPAPAERTRGLDEPADPPERAPDAEPDMEGHGVRVDRSIER